MIVGINAFDHDVGPQCMSAPEHSQAFNKQVKLYQAMARAELSAQSKGRAKEVGSSPQEGVSEGEKDGGKKGMDLGVIMQNAALRKLMVIAKRERVKEDLKVEKARLAEGVLAMCREAGPGGGVRVRDVVERLRSRDEENPHPNENDIVNHVGIMLGDEAGKLTLVCSGEDENKKVALSSLIRLK